MDFLIQYFVETNGAGCGLALVLFILLVGLPVWLIMDSKFRDPYTGRWFGG